MKSIVLPKKNSMTPSSIISLLVGLFLWSAHTTLHAPRTSAAGSSPPIQVALLLDTSNSMDGLIEQAKSQLWRILLELTKAEKDGQNPEIEIALYEYGNNGLNVRQGFVRQVVAFTTDMDAISAELFALTTNGGEEYCGQVIHDAIGELQWSANEDALRLIYIAGNEPFSQGNLPFQQACAEAVGKDVIVNTIYCGNCQAGIQELWKRGAELGKGEYACINQDEATVYIQTPYDEKLGQLNEALNDTYVAFGREGRKKMENQRVQDANAEEYGISNMADRAAFKASSSYRNSSWDLVDAWQEDTSILKKRDQLPESWQQLNDKEVLAKVKALHQERQDIQQQIQMIQKEREAWLAEQQAANEENDQLGASILQPLREAAMRKGYEFEGE